MGSVMNISRMLGVPRDLAGAARTIAAGREASIDVGEANGEIFFEDASVGIQAAMFRHADGMGEGRSRSDCSGQCSAAFRYRPRRMELRLDARRHVATRALMVDGLERALCRGRHDRGTRRAPRRRQVRRRHLGALLQGRAVPPSGLNLVRPAALLAAHVDVSSRSVSQSASRPLPCRARMRDDLGTTPLECRVRAECSARDCGPGLCRRPRRAALDRVASGQRKGRGSLRCRGRQLPRSEGLVRAHVTQRE